MNQIPQFIPPVQSTPNTSSTETPNQPNVPGSFEKQSQQARTATRSRKVRAATNQIINSRASFANYLAQGGLGLLTSSIEFQQNGDFILSSYVVYPDHKNFKEPLPQFLSRYPELQQSVIAINDQLKPLQGDMEIITPERF